MALWPAVPLYVKWLAGFDWGMEWCRLRATMTDEIWIVQGWIDKCDNIEVVVERCAVAYPGELIPSEEDRLSTCENWTGLETSVMQTLVEAIQM